jgi:hypothetical protein
MLGFLLGLLLTTIPPASGQLPGWRVVLARGATPGARYGRVTTGPDGYVKWLIADQCLITLEARTEVVLSTGTGRCPRVHLVEGTVRIVAPASDPVDLTWAGGARRVVGVVSMAVSGGRPVEEPQKTREPAPDTTLSTGASPVWQLQTRLGALLRETFSGSGDTVVQTGAAGSMCLDSGGSAGDVGNNQTGITQMPPAARLQVRIPYPRPEGGR